MGRLDRTQESEGEEAAEAKVDLAQDMGRGNLASRQSRVRLQEVHSASSLSRYRGLHQHPTAPLLLLSLSVAVLVLYLKQAC